MDGIFDFILNSGKIELLDPKALVINRSIESLISILSKKSFPEFQKAKYSKKLSKDKINDRHIDTIKKLLNDLVSLCAKKDLDDETVLKVIKFVKQVTKSYAEKSYTENYSDKQKQKLLTATLELLSVQKFQNQIFTEKNCGLEKEIVDNEEVCELKAIGQYIDTLVNISNSNLFKFLSPGNQNKFFDILKLLFEDEQISQNIFNADNLGDQGPIRLYITALSNTAAKIRPLENINQDSKTKRNNRKKHNSMKNNHDEGKKVEIFNYNVRFLLKATKKIVTDKNLKMLVSMSKKIHYPLNCF